MRNQTERKKGEPSQPRMKHRLGCKGDKPVRVPGLNNGMLSQVNTITPLFVPLWLAAVALLPAAAANRPNVLIIQPDQHRGTVMGCMGDAQAKTPNLDQLAREGILVRKCVSSSPVCCPFRATLQTGLYPHSRTFERKTMRSLTSPNVTDYA
jgi:hypothetical protein